MEKNYICEKCLKATTDSGLPVGWTARFNAKDIIVYKCADCSPQIIKEERPWGKHFTYGT